MNTEKRQSCPLWGKCGCRAYAHRFFFLFLILLDRCLILGMNTVLTIGLAEGIRTVSLELFLYIRIPNSVLAGSNIVLRIFIFPLFSRFGSMGKRVKRINKRRLPICIFIRVFSFA